MNMCTYMYCVCLDVCMSTCMYVVCVCVWVYVRVSLCSVACCSNFRLVCWDPDPIQIRVRCGTDTLVIRKPIYKMIRRSVLAHTVKTRWQFGSKIASFHVSVCFCVISLFTVINAYLCYIRIISCDRLIYFTSMITHIISCGTSECSLWLYSLSECPSAAFHVLVFRRRWLRPSIDTP